MMTKELICWYEPFFREQIAFHYRQIDTARREVALAGPLITTLKTFDEADFVVQEPTFRLDQQGAQKLLDELWRLGIRPSNGEGNIGQIGAMREHLDDMRKLVFKDQSLTMASS